MAGSLQNPKIGQENELQNIRLLNKTHKHSSFHSCIASTCTFKDKPFQFFCFYSPQLASPASLAPISTHLSNAARTIHTHIFTKIRPHCFTPFSPSWTISSWPPSFLACSYPLRSSSCHLVFQRQRWACPHLPDEASRRCEEPKSEYESIMQCQQQRMDVFLPQALSCNLYSLLT